MITKKSLFNLYIVTHKLRTCFLFIVGFASPKKETLSSGLFLGTQYKVQKDDFLPAELSCKENETEDCKKEKK